MAQDETTMERLDIPQVLAEYEASARTMAIEVERQEGLRSQLLAARRSQTEHVKALDILRGVACRDMEANRSGGEPDSRARFAECELEFRQFGERRNAAQAVANSIHSLVQHCGWAKDRIFWAAGSADTAARLIEELTDVAEMEAAPVLA